MLPLSEELLKIIKPEIEKPKQVLKIPCGILKLYSSIGGVDDRLIDAGFLNFVLRGTNGQLLGYAIEDFENTPIIVESMETLKQPDSSSVTNIWIEEDTVYAHHWDCFTSRFDPSTMKLIGQKFTH